jgi:hypothetical protein
MNSQEATIEYLLHRIEALEKKNQNLQNVINILIINKHE